MACNYDCPQSTQWVPRRGRNSRYTSQWVQRRRMVGQAELQHSIDMAPWRTFARQMSGVRVPLAPHSPTRHHRANDDHSVNRLSGRRTGDRASVAPASAGESSGFVDGECGCAEECGEGERGVDEWGRVADPVEGDRGVGFLCGHGVEGGQVDQQHCGGQQVDGEFGDDPVVSQLAPGGAERLDDPGEQAAHGERHQDIPVP